MSFARVATAAAAVGLSLSTLVAGVAVGEVPGTRGLRAIVAGAEVVADVRYEIVVDDEVGDAPAARLTFTRAEAVVGADVKVVVHPDGATIFTGEVVGIEPSVETGDESRVVIHAVNRVQRLARGRHSRTYEWQTDAEIVAAIAAEHGLIATPDAALGQRYPVVVQHDQTDLEFLLERAARIGFEVFVDDRTLYFQSRNPTAVELGPLRARPEAQLRVFHPRLSSTDSLQQVLIRGRTADGTPVVGQASVPTRWLVPELDDPLAIVGRTSEIVVHTPLPSAEAAAALAREGLELAIAHRVSAEALAGGSAALRPGRLLAVQGANAPFDGTYYVQGVSHRYAHPESGGGYRAVLRLRRADGAMFFVPSIDDEVLVAFEHGDLREAVVVGSLWDSNDCPPPCRDCLPCDDDAR
jgi:phage protein D